MSFALEALGRGLLGRLTDAFHSYWPKERLSIPELEKLCAEMPTSADLAERLGAAQLRSMHLVHAQTAFDRALSLNRGSRLARIGLACVWDERGRIEESLRWLGGVGRSDPKDPVTAFALGFCRERLGETAAAEADYRRACKLCPTLHNAWERRAALAARAGRWDVAADAYRELVDLAPESTDYHLLLGALEFNAGRPERAIEAFQSALLVEPECSTEEVRADAALATDDDLESAVSVCEQLVHEYPGAVEFRVRLGDLYVRRGDDPSAVSQYRAALTMRPDLLEATIKLGAQHLRQRRHLDAADCFNRAAELNDRLLVAFAGLGLAQRSAGLADDADATLDLAMSLAPNSTLLAAETSRLHRRWWRMAQTEPTSSRIGRVPDGVEAGRDLRDMLHAFGRACERHAQCAELSYRYGMLLRQTGELPQALDALRHAVTIDPAFSRAWIAYGAALRETGRLDDSVGAFERGLRVAPDGIEVHYQLGLLFAQRGQFELLVEDQGRQHELLEGDFAFRQTLLLGLQHIGMVDPAAAGQDLVRTIASDELPAGARTAQPASAPGARRNRRFDAPPPDSSDE